MSFMASATRKKDKKKKRAEARPQRETRLVNPVSVTACAIIIVAVSAVATLMASLRMPDVWIAAFSCIGLLVAFYLLFALKIAQQWEKAIVLRLGKFCRLAGPGLFWILPIVDSVPSWIDHRVMVTPFNAERTLTKDTVPVSIDAVLFWVVWDAEKAALEVEDYEVAIAWAAQTALRDIIGRMMLSDILVGREMIDEELQHIIDERTTPWGITVQSVEIRDIIIPEELEDTMSRQAQAERERQARVILGESEKQIAESFVEAGRTYEDHPTALHLRAMNMLFEGLKEKGAMLIVPSSAVDTMNLGGLAGLAAYTGGVLPQDLGAKEEGDQPPER
jgi:regulator of protease activity HflC (stomatin/prohibitin superfamily)